MRRVLVLRAREDAERTGERLRALGFEPLLSPVLEIVATGAPPPQGAFDAALATSFKGVELAAFSLPLPLHAVGARALEAAAARGWREGLRAKSAAALAELVLEAHPAPARFLYLAGRDRKDALETGVRAAGHEVVVVETYEARAATALSDEALAALAAGEVAAALHYSRRSAEIFAALALARQDAALLRKLRSVLQLALSADVAEPLAQSLSLEPRIAATPDEDALFAQLPR